MVNPLTVWTTTSPARVRQEHAANTVLLVHRQGHHHHQQQHQQQQQQQHQQQLQQQPQAQPQQQPLCPCGIAGARSSTKNIVGKHGILCKEWPC